MKDVRLPFHGDGAIMPTEMVSLDALPEHTDASSQMGLLSSKTERCPKESPNQSDRQKQKRESQGGPSKAEIRCPICRKCFTRRYHLKRHMNMSSCSDNPSVTFPCVICSKVFAKEARLEAHLRAHAERKDVRGDFCCNVCGKCYEGQSLLKIHQRSHTGDRPFPCPECPMSFVSLGSLNKHLLTHSSARRHACPHCPLRFTLKGTLTRHLNTHAKLLPFKCPHCDRRYAQSGSLKVHMFTHTRKDGFSCQLCGRSFARKSSLQMHVLGVHRKERPHNCKTCGKRYARRDDLDEHCSMCNSASRKALLKKLSNSAISLRRFFSELISSGRQPVEIMRQEETNDAKQSCEPCCNKQTTLTQNVPKPADTNEAYQKSDEDSDNHSSERVPNDESLATQLDSFQRKLKSQSILLNAGSQSHRRELSELELGTAIEELLLTLMEESTLRKLGWPDIPTGELLEALIRQCGCSPAQNLGTTIERLRENCRVLFTTVLEDQVVKRLFGDLKTVDGVLERVLQLEEW